MFKKFWNRNGPAGSPIDIDLWYNSEADQKVAFAEAKRLERLGYSFVIPEPDENGERLNCFILYDQLSEDTDLISKFLKLRDYGFECFLKSYIYGKWLVKIGPYEYWHKDPERAIDFVIKQWRKLGSPEPI